MSKTQSNGIFAALIGVALVGFGVGSSTFPGDQISHSMMANHFNTSAWCVALGTMAIVGGMLLRIFGKRIV